MTALAIFGWLIFCGAALWLLLAGGYFMWVTSVCGGRPHPACLILVIAGAAALAFAGHISPIHISVEAIHAQ